MTRNVRITNYVDAAVSDEPPRDPRVQKFIDLLTSRKLWTLLIGIVAANGIVSLSEIQEAEVVNAILTLIGFALIGLNIAVEDGLRAWSEARRK